jgi:pyruvate carboxylase subunit A
MISKVLIANRAEAAVRVIRTCRDMGIRTVAIYSDVDADSLHVRLADEAYNVGAPSPSQSYLNMQKILEVAERSGAEAIHPSYGFLAENPDFAEMCEERGIIFIGPSSGCMYRARPKHKARQLMKMVHVPVVPGSEEAIEGVDSAALSRAQEVADSIGYPVVVKPTGTGGGIGMMVAENREQLIGAAKYAVERGRSAFGVSGYYIEKLLRNIKHVEFQVLADTKGNVVHLGERECSIQRRFQKMVEESPCSVLTPFLRMKMAVAAIDIARMLRYVNALTVEFLYYPDTQEFYFNEINCRLQIEHPLTESVTGIDVVREQIIIASGNEISCSQDDIRIRGHAVECRITAEDPLCNFIPSPGILTRLRLPHGLGIRVDEGVYEGYEVPFDYDSLLFKIVASGRTRGEALERMRRALDETVVEGIKTIIPFQRAVIGDEEFINGSYTTNFLKGRKVIKLEPNGLRLLAPRHCQERVPKD